MYKYPTQYARHRTRWRHRTYAWHLACRGWRISGSSNKLTVYYHTSHIASKSCKFLRIDHYTWVLAPIFTRQPVLTFHTTMQGGIAPIPHPLTMTSTPKCHESLLPHYRAARDDGDGHRRISPFFPCSPRLQRRTVYYHQIDMNAANRPPSGSRLDLAIRYSPKLPISSVLHVRLACNEGTVNCF
jgi:hypothetical protein